MFKLRARPMCCDCEMPVSSWAEGCECGVAVLCSDCHYAHELIHRRQLSEPEPVDDYPPVAVDAEQVRDWQRLIARSNAEHPGYPGAGYTQAIRRPDEPVAQGEAA